MPMRTEHQQQHAVSNEVIGDSLRPLISAQSIPSVTGEQGLEQTDTESIQAFMNEFALEAKRRKRLWWIVWGIMVGSSLPMLGLNLYLIPRVHFGHWSTTLMMALQMLTPLCCLPFF